MSPLVALPIPDFVADTDANADDIDANFAAILAVLNGGLDDTNISAGARIDGNKLSNESGKQVPEDRLGANAVSFRVLSSHATTDISRAVGTDHLRDGAVTAAKIAALTITNAQMAVGAALANLAAASVPSGKLKVTLATAAVSVAGVSNAGAQATLTLSGTFAKATYDLYAVYFKNPAGAAYTTDNAVATLYPDDTGATNWALKISAVSGSSTPRTLTGTAIAVFISKA